MNDLSMDDIIYLAEEFGLPSIVRKNVFTLIYCSVYLGNINRGIS